MTRSTAVEARGVGVVRGPRRHRRAVLHDIGLDLPVGSITGLFGPSGCGKTTLMRSLTGLQRHTGDLRVLGHAAGSAALRGRIGYVTQSPSLYPELTVEQNLTYFARLAGGTAEGIVEKLGVQEVRHHRVADLSGGQRGRASLGAALVGDPELLIMDEPTVGLDPVIRTRLWDTFRNLAQQGRTLLVSSHVMEEAAQCDALLLMREGRIIWRGTPSGLLSDTATDSHEEAFLSVITEAREEQR